MAEISNRNVAPCVARNNGLQVCELNAENSGYLFTWNAVSKHLLHLSYLIVRKLRDVAVTSAGHIFITANSPVFFSLVSASFNHHVSRIFLGCASLQVCWIAASRIIANVHSDQVANIKPKGEDQGDSMCPPTPEIKMSNPVADTVNASSPHPAGVRVSDRDISPKPSLLVFGQDWVWSKLSISHLISFTDRWLWPRVVLEHSRGLSHFSA